jgi:diguanylate cyclase (GGDEF)-like protein
MPSPEPSLITASLDWASAPPAAQRQALSELGRRADRGTWLHPALWVLLALASDCHRVWPAFFWANSIVFVAIAVLRFILSRQLKTWFGEDLSRPTRLMVAALLLTALHWGVTSVLMLSSPPLASTMRTLMFIVMGALAASGTMVLSIHPVVRRWYALAVVLPAQLWVLLHPNLQDMFVLAASLMMVAYIVSASRTVYDDYWSAVQARLALERQAMHLERLSAFDALTQVHNRFTFDRRLEAMWAVAERRRAPLALLMIDVDHFKRLNDTHGHVAGDSALRRTADALRQYIRRATDVLARYGGEEFVVLLPDTGLENALALAEQLRAAVASQSHPGSHANLRVTCSIGVHVIVPRAGQNLLDLVRGADEALYAAKGAGRNRVQALAPGDGAALVAAPADPPETRSQTVLP